MIFLSRLAILISWTLQQRLCTDMKYFIQETGPSIIHNYLFVNNAVAASFWKIVNKANKSKMRIADTLYAVSWGRLRGRPRNSFFFVANFC